MISSYHYVLFPCNIRQKFKILNSNLLKKTYQLSKSLCHFIWIKHLFFFTSLNANDTNSPSQNTAKGLTKKKKTLQREGASLLSEGAFTLPNCS